MAKKKTASEKAATKAKAAEARAAKAAERKAAKAEDQVDDGLVAFQCPSHTGNIGVGREHGSKQYAPDENGVVRVERRDADMMARSGFAPIKG